MSLDKAIQHGKEKRKPYRKSKAISKSCRHGGACSRCRDDRTYSSRKMLAKSLYVDPPSGWLYGFPKEWDKEKHPDLKAWMAENGYPKKLADKGLPVRFILTSGVTSELPTLREGND